jgi:hypothetical protein
MSNVTRHHHVSALSFPRQWTECATWLCCQVVLPGCAGREARQHTAATPWCFRRLHSCAGCFCNVLLPHAAYLHIEVPVLALRQLAHDVARGDVPADGAVVLGTAQQQRGILGAPRHAQHTLQDTHSTLRTGSN